jgi:uncharacterized phage protein (TIGR02218 family)
MTYAAFDTSIQDGDPVYLMLFVRDGTEWRYTNAALSVIALSETWLASSVEMGAKSMSKEVSKNSISFKFPRNNSFAAAFLAGRSDAVTSITVYRGHIGDPDDEWNLWWKGRDTSTKYGKGVITIEAESVLTTAKQNGLQRKYQKGCSHALYQRGCNLDMASFEDSLSVAAVDGVTLTVTGADSEVDGFYTGGVFEASDGTLRFIRSHVGETITLAWPIDGLTTGTHSLYPGCNRTLATCDAKFSNAVNFGGQPWIPGANNNPMGGSSIV